jgi:LysM repeat protein
MFKKIALATSLGLLTFGLANAGMPPQSGVTIGVLGGVAFNQGKPTYGETKIGWGGGLSLAYDYVFNPSGSFPMSLGLELSPQYTQDYLKNPGISNINIPLLASLKFYFGQSGLDLALKGGYAYNNLERKGDDTNSKLKADVYDWVLGAAAEYTFNNGLGVGLNYQYDFFDKHKDVFGKGEHNIFLSFYYKFSFNNHTYESVDTTVDSDNTDTTADDSANANGTVDNTSTTPDQSQNVPASQPANQVAQGGTTITVQKGDTLSQIATNHGLGAKAGTRCITIANHQEIGNPHWIYPGQKIVIPANC